MAFLVNSSLVARALVLGVLCGRVGLVVAFFGWMKETPTTVEPPPAVVSANTHGETPPFEMTTADDRFLAEAKQLELSPLDSCHYKVIAQLKSSCSGLSEEEIAKLGVVLFNCQAEVEGRKTYPCTPEMTIKECTEPMDADTWNAYHIVSNRARSVCYTTRQQHFKRRTEVTVNSLVATATSQLEAMRVLKDGQAELKELTASSLEKVLSSQSSLLEQQGALQQGQEELESSIDINLERLAQEKALIASGHQLVAQLIEGITHRMDNVSKHLKGQGEDLQEGHQAILADLAEVRSRAQDIYSKIDSNLSGFLRYQNRTARYFEQLMGNLQRMNSTLGTLLHYMDRMQGSVESRLQHIQGFIGWVGVNLSAVSTCVLHTGYFLLAALLMTFLQTPGLPRAMLLVLVVLNALSELNQQPAMDFRSLTILLVLAAIGNWFLLRLVSGCSAVTRRRSQAALPASSTSETLRPVGWPLASTPNRDLADVKDDLPALEQDSCLFDEGSLVDLSLQGAEPLPPRLLKMRPRSEGTPSHSTPLLKKRTSLPVMALEGVPQRHLGSLLDGISESRLGSPNQSMGSNGSMSGRQLCSGITKTGLLCKKRAVRGWEFCHVHEAGQASYTS
ncbi:protein brambleberry [Acipenser ruthenus]|uniref:protein brambleberry n=1 Tax=Acipenser ruthenus TaxID=7906 RepID=UPI002741887E|nr:protein brambleberry [Acipenser ruthenus]XP_058874634.1 protein brambleberry [Acipenser ruthenus]